MPKRYTRKPKYRNPHQSSTKIATSHRMKNQHIRIMGFESYADYLKSYHWHKIRQRVLARDLGRCLACDEEAQQVHHTRYTEATLKGKTLRFLWSLCKKCHETIEFREDGRKIKRTRGVNQKLAQMLKSRGKDFDTIEQSLKDREKRGRRNAPVASQGRDGSPESFEQ